MTKETLSLQEKLGRRFYWLCRCEGFRVESPEGRFGLVEAVMFRVRPDEPDALIVRAGVLAHKLVIVPIEDVDDIAPRRERVMLKRVPELSSTDFVTDVRARLRRLAAEGTGAPGSLGLRSVGPLPEGN
jgi:hypothetical protein